MSAVSHPTTASPWASASRAQWQSFWSAFLGWMLDIMDLMLFAMVAGAVGKEMGLGKADLGMLASATLLATAFGGLIFGFVADRLGRTRSLTLSILTYSAGTALCGVSQTLTQLLLCRVVLGLGVGGEWSAGAALLSETWPAAHRGKVIAWVQSAFAVGYAAAALVAALLMPHFGWRGVFLFGLAPALLAFWIRRHTPESPLWREQTHRMGFGETLSALFGEHRRSTLVGLAFTASAMCGYWGLFTWIPTYLATPVSAGGPGLSLVKSTAWIVTMQAGAAAGFILFGYIADRIGRRGAFMLFFFMATVVVPLFVLIRSPEALLPFGAVVAFFGTGFYSGFAPTFAELFPTTLRATAQGFIYNTGRASSALAPWIIGKLAELYGLGGALGFTAGFFALAGIIVWAALPETRGEVLQ